MLLALQGLCESKPSDYVAWRSFLTFPQVVSPILGLPGGGGLPDVFCRFSP